MSVKTVRLVEVPVALTDGVHRLRYDLNALALLEEGTGQDIVSLTGQLQQGKVSAIRAFLWAGLAHEGPKPKSMEQIGALVPIHALGDLIAAITQALSDSLPETQEGDKQAGNPT